jgi:hypothetical protein
LLLCENWCFMRSKQPSVEDPLHAHESRSFNLLSAQRPSPRKASCALRCLRPHPLREMS